MKLSAIVTDYRRRMNISQREFARACNLSNSYISFIENESNPKTGRPIVPTLEQYGKLASAMQLTVHELFKMMDDDSPVDISIPSESVSFVLDDDEKKLVSLWRGAEKSARQIAMETLSNHQKKIARESAI